MISEKIDVIKAETEQKQVETEHLKVKGKVEERIIHAYSNLAIIVGTILIIAAGIITYIIKVVGFIR